MPMLYSMQVANLTFFFPLDMFSLVRKKAAGLESAATIRTKVFVWGLNDKDQLGGLKGSKVCLLFSYFSTKQTELKIKCASLAQLRINSNVFRILKFIIKSYEE